MSGTRATLEDEAREALSDEIETGLHVPFYVQPHMLVKILDERSELLDAALEAYDYLNHRRLGTGGHTVKGRLGDAIRHARGY